MSKVFEVLAQKVPALFTAAPGDPVQKALEMMHKHRVRSVVVIEGDKLVGIVSERDCALKVLLPGLDSGQVKIDQIMTREVVTVGPEDTLDKCMQEMSARSIRHLPVCDDGRVVGMLSIGDAMKEIMRQQEQHIKYLETYIKGNELSYR
jgi:CBS domain-containing protein